MADEKMNTTDKTGKAGGILSLILLIVMIIAIIALIIQDVVDKKDKAASTTVSAIAGTETTPKVRIVQKVVEKEVEKLVEVEKKVSSEMIQDGLKDMGVLITEEYYFTQVEDYTSVKKIFKVIPTESNVVFSYDGIVTAGIDCSEITVKKDETNKQVVITLPRSKVQQIDIDFDSFKLYSQKEGMWNKLDFDDYNLSMVEFEKDAEAKALDKGILERADERAESVISNFVKGILDDDTYSVGFEWR